jgi:anti-anti-sigma regulatory factor
LAEIERGSQPAPLHAEVLQEGILIAGGVANLTTVFEQLRQAGLQRLVPGDLARFDHFSAWLLTIHNQLAGIAALQVGNQLERQRESTVAETLLLTHLTRSDANPLFLDWMDVSWADWAALALWDNRTDQRRVLHVASTFERGVGARMLNTPCLASEFPATQLAPARFSQAPEYILKLSPLHSPAREWGYLATYERYRPTGYNTITSRNTFLATMLERSDLISSLTERQEVLQQAYDRERMLASTIRELGCPLIPLLPGVLMVPLVGAIDEQRAQQIIERVLAGVSQEQANRVLLDITGVPLVDTYVAAALMRMAQAVRLLGARVILVGVRPEIAQSIIGLNVDLGTIETRPTLGAALQLLLRRQTSSVGNAT